MTNFEKWKSELTLDDLIPHGRAAPFYNCQSCPVAGHCEETSDRRKNSKRCHDVFKEWAESEVTP